MKIHNMVCQIVRMGRDECSQEAEGRWKRKITRMLVLAIPTEVIRDMSYDKNLTLHYVEQCATVLREEFSMPPCSLVPVRTLPRQSVTTLGESAVPDDWTGWQVDESNVD